MNYNKVIIVGRATAAPQLRTTPGGQSVTTVGVATNRKWTQKDGKEQQEVEFHNVVIFGKLAEVASTYLAKGSLVLFEGRLRTRTWADKDGTSRRATEIVAEGMQLGPKGTPKPEGEKPELAPEETIPADGELPDITADEDDTGKHMLPF